MAWEYGFLSWLQGLHAPTLSTVMVALSLMGAGGAVWWAVAVAMLLIRRWRRTGIEVVLAMAIGFLVGNLLLKNLVGRARPFEAYESLVPLGTPPTDRSFPSGHTLNGFAAAVTIFLANRRWGVPALTLASLIAFSRMYNLVHYPTDIMGGLVVGVAAALAGRWVLARALASGRGGGLVHWLDPRPGS